MKGDACSASASTLSLDHGQSLLPSVNSSVVHHSPGAFWSPSISSIYPSLKNTPFPLHSFLGTLEEAPEAIEEDPLKQQQTSPFLQMLNPREAMLDEAELRLDDDLPRLSWCAFCGKEVMANCSFKASSKTFWSSIGIFFLGGVLGCFLLPYCSNSCKTLETHCSRCGRTV